RLRCGRSIAGMGEDEGSRIAMLLDAQDKAAELLAEIERTGQIRAGENTLQPYRKNPPNRIIADDDIVFCDFGPIFDRWEADFGRTFVLGDDERKHALGDDLPRVWAKGREYFDSHPDITGAELFDHVVDLSHDAGW